ncbi:hypothetical protein [Ekhidna sp.]|jgi:hypothetical protein|uniref:hypothetical protein n=1 Tax=Ekhidna sp. TaxID=2608089 RepID=UPI0032ED0ABE
MKAIGGFLEEEDLSYKSINESINEKLSFSNGRSALFSILKNTKPQKIYLPYYICDAILQPIKKLEIKYTFILLNEALEFEQLPNLKDDEFILGVNYYGLKTQYMKTLLSLFKTRLIIDNSQAFFAPHINTWTFNSLRKFFGVPDGSLLSTPYPIKILRSGVINTPNTSHLELRREGQLEQAYKFYQVSEGEHSVNDFKISAYSSHVIRQLDFEYVKLKRINNYRFLDEALKTSNNLHLDLNTQVPLYYPYWSKKRIHHQIFWDQMIFVPFLWEECLSRQEDFDFEKKLCQELIPLPIDHRYGLEEMEMIVHTIEYYER